MSRLSTLPAEALEPSRKLPTKKSSSENFELFDEDTLNSVLGQTETTESFEIEPNPCITASAPTIQEK